MGERRAFHIEICGVLFKWEAKQLKSYSFVVKQIKCENLQYDICKNCKMLYNIKGNL